MPVEWVGIEWKDLNQTHSKNLETVAQKSTTNGLSK